jgi:hypothetical protein
MDDFDWLGMWVAPANAAPVDRGAESFRSGSSVRHSALPHSVANAAFLTTSLTATRTEIGGHGDHFRTYGALKPNKTPQVETIGKPEIRTTNQKVGSSNLSGRTTFESG